MINRDARGKIELLCCDNNKWCTHNHRTSASCRSHHDTRSTAHCFISEREDERDAVCSILPLVATARLTLFSGRYGPKTTRQFVESRAKKKRIFLSRTTSKRALFRGPFHGTCDSFKIALIPSPAAFHLITFSMLFAKVIALIPYTKQGKLTKRNNHRDVERMRVNEFLDELKPFCIYNIQVKN